MYKYIRKVYFSNISFFSDWYSEKIESGEFSNPIWQNLTKTLLNDVLARFYVEVRKRDGKPYSKQAYAGLRAGIQRHLSDGPWFVTYYIVSDPAFKQSNDTMAGVFKWLAKEGLDKVQHHEPIDPMDIEKLKTTNVIGTENPLALQRLVWLGIALHFGRRGREGYRTMNKDFFEIHMGADGRRYMEQTYCEKNKNHQGDKSNNSYMAQGRMYEQAGNEYCPIRAYELYMSLINAEVECMWQRPNMKFMATGNWYHMQVVGKHTIGNFLKDMCKDAGITTVYTNHCTRVTTSVLLNEAGFGENDIIHVTGHKSTSSLSSYINKASNVKKRKMADTISNVFFDGPSTSTSGMPTTKLVHPVSPIVGHPTTAPEQVDALDTSDIIHFNIDNCEELTDSDMAQYLNTHENKENDTDLSDKDITQYMQMFEKNITKGGMFQGCTINNPVFNITIQK